MIISNKGVTGHWLNGNARLTARRKMGYYAQNQAIAILVVFSVINRLCKQVVKLLDVARTSIRVHRGVERPETHDWQIETLKDIVKRFNVEWRQPGTSHVTFRHPNGSKLTVPAHRPIKPIYIKKFVRLIDEGGEE